MNAVIAVPAKVEFIFELLFAVVRPDSEVPNSTMLSMLVVCRVCSKYCVNEVGDLLIALVEIRSNAGVGNAG